MSDHPTDTYIRRYKRQFNGVMLDSFKQLGRISNKFDDLAERSLLNGGSIDQLQDGIEELRSKLESSITVLSELAQELANKE